MGICLKCLAYFLESMLGVVFIIFIVSISGRGNRINKGKEFGSGRVWEIRVIGDACRRSGAEWRDWLALQSKKFRFYLVDGSLKKISLLN